MLKQFFRKKNHNWRLFFLSLFFLSINSFWQSSPIGDSKIRSSSFVFIFVLRNFFQNYVKTEIYCVLVVGPKKQSSHFSVFRLRLYICSNFRGF